MTREPPAWLWWLALAAAVAALLYPLTVVDVPPLLDYPNHLARLFVLAHSDDPVLARFYAPRWSVMPNLVIDALFPPLLRVLPVHLAGRIIIGLTLLLPLVGCIAYSRAVFRRRSLWPIACALVCYNAPLFLGFLNFQLSLGLALLFAACWHAWSWRYPLPAALAGIVAGVALFFGHLFGLAFFGVLIGAAELAALPGRVTPAYLTRRAAMVAALFALPAALFFAAPFSGTGNDWSATQTWVGKLFVAFSPFANHRLGVTAILAGSVLAAIAALGIAGHLRARAGALIAIPTLAVAYVLTPSVAMATGFVDTRLPIMVLLVLFAAVAPTDTPRWLGGIVAAVLAAGLVYGVASTADIWRGQARDLADLRRILEPVEPGAKVLAVDVSPDSNPDYWAHAPANRVLPGYMRLTSHLPALLLIEHRAFWPLLFTAHDKQPVTVQPAFRPLSAEQGIIPDLSELSGHGGLRPGNDTSYLADWQYEFDYVLLLDPDAAGDPANVLPDRLELLRTNDMAALYRVRRLP